MVPGQLWRDDFRDIPELSFAYLNASFLTTATFAFPLQILCSMSPIRGDVKKKTPPSSPQEAADVVACIQPDLQLEKSFVACNPDRP